MNDEDPLLTLTHHGLSPKSFGQDEIKAYEIIMTFLDGMRSAADGDVRFMIIENGAKYHIGLYYDDLHN